MSKRTPTPWRIGKDTQSQLNDPRVIYAPISLPSGHMVAIVADCSHNSTILCCDEQVANAHFIVQAANMFDDLVTVLAGLVEAETTYQREGSEKAAFRIDYYLDQARAVLAILEAQP